MLEKSPNLSAGTTDSQGRRKIFNLGFSKTGTTSLEKALQQLGYRVARGHWKYNYCFYLFALAITKQFEEIIRVTRYFDAFCDAPWGGSPELYKHLVKEYPDASYILSTRPPQDWLNSFKKFITLFDQDEHTAMSSMHSHGMFGSIFWFRNIFGITEILDQDQHLMEVYSRYNENVQRFFKENKIPLLEIDLTTPNQWEKLCEFLDCPVPDEPFPHLNSAYMDWSKNKKHVSQMVSKHLELDWSLGSTL